MNSRSMLNLLLLLLVIGLASFVYRQQSQTEQTFRLTHLSRDAIDRILIPRSKGDILLEKIDGRWHMQSPYKLRAHDFRIQRLIDMATSTVDKPYPMDELDTADFGLDENASSIRFNDTLIRYGSINQVNGKRYVQVDQQLYLINDQLYPLINSQPSSFADLALLDDSQNIRAIILPDLHIEKNSRGSWAAQPADAASADSIQALVNNWQTAQAFGVHGYMQRKQLGRIQLQLDAGETIDLEISDTSPWLILGRPELGIEYHFDKNFNQRLLQLEQPEASSKNHSETPDA